MHIFIKPTDKKEGNPGPSQNQRAPRSGHISYSSRGKNTNRNGWTVVELMVVVFVASIGAAMAVSIGLSQVKSARSSSLIRGMHNSIAMVRARAMALQKHVPLSVISDTKANSDSIITGKAGSGWATDYQIFTKKDTSGSDPTYEVYFIYRDRTTSDGKHYYNVVLDNGGESKIWFGPKGLAKIKNGADYNYVSDCKIKFSGYGFGISSSDPIVMEVTPLGRVKLGGSL